MSIEINKNGILNEIVGWTQLNRMNQSRSAHTASLLLDGKVLVTGGEAQRSRQLNSAELFDPDTGIWSIVSPMNFHRGRHTASVLKDGTVLVTGGLSA